jgi:ORF6N domain
MSGLVPIERIEKRILFLRGQKVMLDADLARIYGVTTARLNQQVKRNQDRFPAEFMFQLTKEEFDNLMLQFATSSPGYGGRRKRPYVFTEHGAIMLASVLNSPIAVRASLQVVRAFVRLREMLATHKDLARKLEALERKYDSQFKVVFDAIRQLMAQPEPKEKKIGFRARERQARYKISGRKNIRIDDGASLTGRMQE